MTELQIAQLRSKRLSITIPDEFTSGTLPEAYRHGYEVSWRGWDLAGVYYPQQKHRKAFRFGLDAGLAAFAAAVLTRDM